ncbi:11270_t:CDS:2 [Scutellospora calospora]|uniref:11270_t:CDS:1 n=1 Tax=Scutellospora calospora TaxID=85575 RepID=A0ACA9K6P6_9GLOM|nr:11270_t:CDS:2 [Scutellospora calospora]
MYISGKTFSPTRKKRVKPPKHYRNQNNNHDAQFHQKCSSVPYWKPFDFLTIDISLVQSWSTSQLITHLCTMFSQGYFKRDLWTNSLSQKFESQQIDGKKFLKMNRDDLIKAIDCADGIKRLVIGLLEAEVIRLNGRYEDEIYHDPVGTFGLYKRKTQIYKLQTKAINDDKLFREFLVRKLDIIPPAHNLRRYLSSPLTLRIPIPSIYLQLYQKTNPEILCYLIPQKQCLDQLNNLMTAPTLSLPFINAISLPSHDVVLSNYTIIIDSLIQVTLSVLHFGTRKWLYMDRSSSINSPEDILRPDWMCWINELLLVFQGIQITEETDWQIGISYLHSKIHWKSMYYGNLPYTFAYISKSSKLRFFIFNPNLEMTTPLTQISQEFNLNSIMDRFGIIKTVINIYSILETIHKNWNIYDSITYNTPSISSIHPLYLSLQRNGETIIEFFGEFVKKTISSNLMNQFFRFETLCAIYNDTKHINNLVHCVDINGNFDLPVKEKDGACKLLIQPVGYYYYPTNEKEWKSCLKTVLEVLNEMHKRENVVTATNLNDNDGDEWLLIDLEMGGRVGEVLDITLWDRWPKQAEKGQIYKACYDVWQIERMLHEMGDNEFKKFSKNFWKFRDLLRKAAIDEVSAVEALKCEWFIIDNE